MESSYLPKRPSARAKSTASRNADTPNASEVIPPKSEGESAHQSPALRAVESESQSEAGAERIDSTASSLLHAEPLQRGRMGGTLHLAEEEWQALELLASLVDLTPEALAASYIREKLKGLGL